MENAPLASRKKQNFVENLIRSGFFKGQFTTAQVGEDEAPQAPRSSAAGARIEAPTGVGCGEGVLLPTGEKNF